MTEYAEEDYLQLSGLQHFLFCRRQWALIAIENQWAENDRTADGAIMHESAHNASLYEKRGDVLITRGVYLSSRELGVSGQCDVLEFHKSSDGVSIFGHDHLWQPFPVEYKRGKPKENHCDEAQLCGQAICLEEMLSCEISSGALFYGETKHRVCVEFSDELRSEVHQALLEMHELFTRGHTPRVKPKKSCAACSLANICLPALLKNNSVKEYLEVHL